MNTPICPLLTILPPKVYNWTVEPSTYFVSTSNTQPHNMLTVPFYFLIMMFFLFVIVMSVVYVYHWTNFNLGDSFIKNYRYVYFAGLLLLCIPILYLVLK